MQSHLLAGRTYVAAGLVLFLSSVALLAIPAAEAASAPTNELIVHLDPQAAPSARAEFARLVASRSASDRPLVRMVPTADEMRQRFPERSRRAAPEHQARLGRSLDIVRNIRVVEVPAGVSTTAFAAELRALPAVDVVETNAPIELDAVPNDPFFSSSGTWGQPYDDLWGHKAIDVEPAWDLATGAGVVVAVSDTGIDYNHVEMQGKLWVNPVEDINHNGVIDGAPQDCSTSPPPNGDFDCIDNDGNGFVDDVYGWDFVNDDNDPMDDMGHGTHVAGTIAAVGNNATGIIGIAYDAELMPLKAFDPTGHGSITDGAATITYAAAHGADVINMSWGGRFSSPTTQAVVTAAADMGVVLVASAGNDTLDVEYALPAGYDEVLAVAAINQNDEICDFSNFGNGISVAAPGGDNADGVTDLHNNVLSLKSAVETLGRPIVAQDYMRLRGTSMAAPHVSGTAALLLSRQPSASRKLVQVVLEKSADDIADPGFDQDTGHGRINAFSALTLLDQAISRPELIPSISTDTRSAAPDSPVRVTVGVSNVGNVGANSVSVKLYDGAPGAGGTLVRQWTAGSIVADGEFSGNHQYVIPNAGQHELFAVVDEADQILEADEDNNVASTELAVMDHQLVEQVLADDTGLSNPDGKIVQKQPAVFLNRAVWLDNRDITSPSSPYNEIYAYDFSTGVESRVTQATSVKSSPALYDDTLVWLDSRNGPANVYLYDFGTGVETAITSDSYQRYSLDTDGSWIVYSDSRNGNSDVFAYSLQYQSELQLTGAGDQIFPRIDSGCVIFVDSYAGSSIKQVCLPFGSETTLYTSPENVIYADSSGTTLSFSEGLFGTSPRDFDMKLQLLPSGGPQEEISGPRQIDRESRLSPLDLAWQRGFYWTSSDVHVRDLATGAEVRLTETGTVQSMNLGLFRVAWDEVREAESDNLDVFVASRDYVPAAPQNLVATAGNKQIVLDWADNGEADLASYRVYRKVGSGASFALRATVSGSAYTDTGLTNGTTYHYFVTALDAESGESAISNEVSRTPFKPCKGCPDPNQQ